MNQLNYKDDDVESCKNRQVLLQYRSSSAKAVEFLLQDLSSCANTDSRKLTSTSFWLESSEIEN